MEQLLLHGACPENLSGAAFERHDQTVDEIDAPVLGADLLHNRILPRRHRMPRMDIHSLFVGVDGELQRSDGLLRESGGPQRFSRLIIEQLEGSARLQKREIRTIDGSP